MESFEKTIAQSYENAISETIPLNVPTKVVVPKGVLIKIKHLDMKQNQFEFKPFDQVLVRDHNSDQWRCSLFSHKTENNDYVTIHAMWNQCIPYNENTAHLIGTCEPYEEPKPKMYKVIIYDEDGNATFEHFTDDELKHFITVTVIENKNVKSFDVRKLTN